MSTGKSSPDPCNHCVKWLRRSAIAHFSEANNTYFVPFDFIQLLDVLLPTVLLAKEIVQVCSPFLGSKNLSRELLDIGFDVRSENL